MLKLSSPFLLFLLLQYNRDSLGLFLRVETGHQNIAIDGRDVYYGHYTKIHFHNVTCLDAIDIHCLKELTGAEEIDLLYSECAKGHWKVAHYTNSKHHFRLKEPIHALRLLISSRRELSVIDAQVESCSYPPAPPSECHRPTRNHNHRHGKQGSILRAVDPYALEAEAEEAVEAGARAGQHVTRSRRFRRSVPETEDASFETIDGVATITEDKLVPHGHILDIAPGSHLKFAANVGLVVNGFLKIRGTDAQPVILSSQSQSETGRWRGVEFRNASVGSKLQYVKITGSEVAVSVKSGAAPAMEHVFADGNVYGMQMTEMEPTSTTHISSAVLTNNEKTGLEYLGKGAVSIDLTKAASNGGLGIFITTSQKATIRRSSASSNNGTGIYLGAPEVTLEDVAVNGNGFYGVHAEVQKRFEMDRVNVSAHHGGIGVELFLSTDDVKVGIANSRLYDNKRGGLRVSGSSKSPHVIMRGCRFTRNTGETIVFGKFGNASLIVDKSQFTSNSYLDFDGGDAVISVKEVDGTGNQLLISNCQFTKNTMHDVIKVLTSSESPNGSTDVSISVNEFSLNLANSAIVTNHPNISIFENRFQDHRASCEISYSPPATPNSEHLRKNSMLSKSPNPLCIAKGYQGFQMDQPPSSSMIPVVGITENPFKTVGARGETNTIRASEEPYLINEEVTINAGETVIVESGTILDFAPGVGITVAGRLVMNGTEERPIVVRGQNGNTWRGIVAKPEGVLDMKNVVSEDASIGIWIDSEKVRIEGGRIVRPVVHGVEITQNSDDIVDLGGVVIEEASEAAIGVDERRDDVLIKNAIIRNGAGSGIDFMTPAGNIEIQNISIDNMGGYGIHIAEFPSSPLHAVLLDDVSVTNQKKGHAGIMISGGWIQNVGMHNMRFADNSVPSLIVALECNDGNEKLIRLENCTFERNTDIVQHVQLGSCVNLQMEKNRYTDNNVDGIGSTLVITSESKSRKKNGVMELVKNNFTNNAGIYTVILDSNIHDAYFTDNMLTDNANSGAVLKIGGENAKIVTNNFENSESKYQIAYSDDSPIDATFNEWNGLSEEQVLETIDAKRGAVLVVPYGKISTISADDQLDALTTVIPVTVPDALNAQCAHLSYCSRRGTCREGICICPHGFAGFDCSIPLFCNCSGNGLCNLLNICLCNPGWSGHDCSVPKCSENCNGNGKCTAPNQCECAPGWMGDTCTTSSCVDSECVHGRCEGQGFCTCEPGWQGSRCQVPTCSNCSLNGVCTAPNVCHCFEDYGGTDCSMCIGDSCEGCDFDCNHGICEPLTRTCTCSKGWSGGACDICPMGKCDESMRILYIQPATAEMEDTNAVVNVFGDGFSITDNNSYVCTFGRTSVTGHRVSSALIRCPIPANLTLGRHVFSVSKPGAFSVISNAEARPIHFTLFDGCDSTLCQGSCVGPLCICPQGKTGIFCDVIEIIPTIDRRFLEHQRANTAFEGVPYVVMLPTLSSSVLRVNSSIPDLNFIASKGIIAWPEPIGSQEPYEIAVTAFSPAGETTIAWNLTVAPQYAVEVQNVTVEGGKAKIRGRLIGPASTRKSPVIIRVQREAIVDEIRAESDANGDILFDYIPMFPGIYEVSMAHPNVRTDAIRPIRFTIPEINLPIVGESSNSSLTLDITGREDCQVKLIQPRVDSPDVQQHGSQWIVTFGRFWNDEVLASVKCGDAPLEIVRAPAIEKEAVPTTPEMLSLYGSDHLYEVKVHSPSHPFFTPDVDISDDTLQYLSAIPEEHHLRLTFAQPGTSGGNGTIQVNDGSKPLATISYFYAAANKSLYYNFKICVRDEWDGQEGALASSEVALIAIQNQQRGVEVTRPNVRMNVQWADFSLQPGVYNLLVRSELHEPVDQIIELSPLNTSFCVPMVSTRSRNLPSIHCSHFTDPASCDVAVMAVGTANNLPYFHFSPSVVSSNGQKVLVSPRGGLPGTIGLWNSEVDGVVVTPSRRSVTMNESFWISFQWDFDKIESLCGVKSLNVPFVFLPDTSEVPVHTSSTILVKLKGEESGNEICDSSNLPIQPATSTLVMCNCGDGARTRCRERYHSATACGGAWSKIADDTVSLEVLSAFLSMVFECREVSVKFSELQNSLECVASIESDCPINTRKKRASQKDSPFGMLPQMSTVSTEFGKVLPVLNALDVQTIRISSVFMEFVERIQKMFPENLLDRLDREAVDHFLGAISDQSDEGQMISEAERRIIGESAFGLIQLWNLTVKSWRSGKVPTEKLGISYQDARLLVAAADKVKSISRQNVAQDPFSMLHGYMERILETGQTEQSVCATSTVFIDSTEVEEDGQLRIQVFITNRSNVTLTNVGVTLAFVKSEVTTPAVIFNIGPSWSAGIGSLTGLGFFAAGSSFEIHWTRSVSVPKRLTTIAKYQPIIIFSFSSMGRITQQKLFAPEISIIPKKTFRAINIIKDELSPSEGTDFSVISSIINPGYTTLRNVEVRMDELVYSAPTAHLNSVFIDGKPTHKSLVPHFSEIPSGSTRLIRIVMKNGDDVVPVTSVNLTCLESGRLLPLDTAETYAIRAAGISDFGMLLATPQQSAPLFYFRPSAAQMVNVIKLEYLSVQRINSTDRSRTVYVAAFRNPESTSFGGALWARMPVPKVGDDHKLTSIVDRGGVRPRELQAVQWISEENGVEWLNWIDPGTFTSQQMIYDLQFTNPDLNPGENENNPSFDQLQYRIEIPANHLEPDAEIGRIEADGGDELTYFLYSPDNERRFSVDSETGRIFYDSEEPLRSEQEYCVVLEARDPQGRVTRVPVAINNGGQRRDCVLFSTVGLTPMIHFGSYIPMPTIYTPGTVSYTSTQPTPSATTATSMLTLMPTEPSESPTTTEESTSSSTGEKSSTPTFTTSSEDITSSESSVTSSESTTPSSTSEETSSTETTGTTITFVDSTLEPIIVTTEPAIVTTSESILTSSEVPITTESFGSSTSEYVTPPFPTPVTMDPVTNPSSEGTSEGTDFPTPPDDVTLIPIVMSSEASPSDFPTPSGEVTLIPVVSTSSSPDSESTTSSDSFTGYPTSEGTTITSPDSTLPILTTTEIVVTSEEPRSSSEEPITSSEEPVTSTSSSEEPVTYTEEPITSSSTPEEPITSSTPPEEPITSTEEPITSSTAEVTRVLPTDPTTPTTTELIYTVSSDGTLEPITATMEPVTTATEPASPETDATVGPPIRVSTAGGDNVHSTETPGSMGTTSSGSTGTTGSSRGSTATTPPAPGETDMECASTTAALTAFSKIICDIQGSSRRRQRSQF